MALKHYFSSNMRRN